MEEKEREKEAKRQQMEEKKKEQEEFMASLQTWEDGLLIEPHATHMKAMWEVIVLVIITWINLIYIILNPAPANRPLLLPLSRTVEHW
jgi:uncharacterized integral membrane protein